MVVITSFPPPTEGIRHEQPLTRVVMQNRDLGKGTVFITESCLSWVESCSGRGFSVEYPHISLHAVSRDLQAFPDECLYIMLDTTIDLPGNEGAQERVSDEESQEDEGEGLTEIRFVPDDKNCLNAMFSAMSDCQALHPDPNDSFSDDQEEEGDEENGEEYHMGPDGDGLGIHENGRVNLDMEVEGQFEDADMPES